MVYGRNWIIYLPNYIHNILYNGQIDDAVLLMSGVFDEDLLLRDCFFGDMNRSIPIHV